MTVDWGNFTYGAVNSDKTVTIKDATNAAVDVSTFTDFILRCRALDGTHSFDIQGDFVTDGSNGQVAFDSIAAAGNKPKLGKSITYEARVMWNNATGDLEVQETEYRFRVDNFDQLHPANPQVVFLDTLDHLRQLDEAVYVSPSGVGQRNAESIISNNSPLNLNQNTGEPDSIGPQFVTRLISNGVDRVIANDAEWFNQDPWSALNNVADHLFIYRSYSSVFMTLQQDNRTNPVALGTQGGGKAITEGSWIGLSFGEVTSYTTVPGTSHTSFALVFNLYTGHWETWVIDQFGPTNGKRFVTDLGADGGIGLRSMSTSAAAFFLEIDYFPNRRVDFYINRGSSVGGGLVQRWTDAANGGGFTPLANTYAHETSVGLTIKGTTLVATYSNPENEAIIQWYGKRRITDRSYR